MFFEVLKGRIRDIGKGKANTENKATKIAKSPLVNF